MRYTLTFLEEQYAHLIDHLFEGHARPERAAFLICGLSTADNETRLLVRRICLVADRELASQSAGHLTVLAKSFLPIMKQADQEGACFVFVHSHPKGVPEHSRQDDREEPGLFRTAYNRIVRPQAIHASIVISDPELPRGRVWLDGGKTKLVEVIRVIGPQFRFYHRNHIGVPDVPDTSFHDRQVRAFGPDLLPLLRHMTVGVVGAGGTGSAVTEQLIRLGVGSLIIADGQVLEASNVSRVYGSTVGDVGVPKTDIMARLAQQIGLKTSVRTIRKSITYASAMKQFRECDVVFGCTDDQWGRSLLTRFSLQYSVPVFDLGIKIDSRDGTILSIPGRVTTLMPGMRCLFCRRQITSEGVSQEILQELQPQEAAKQRREGYIPELPDAQPAVVAFTTATAAMAVAEFLHRLTAYKGGDYEIGELVVRFDESTIRTPGAEQGVDCFCTDPTLIGRGDQNRFLDQTWRQE